MVKHGLAEVLDSIKEESHDSVILGEGQRDKEALRKAAFVPARWIQAPGRLWRVSC